MPFKIKARLAELDKTQVDLIPELAKKGIKANSTEISSAIRGTGQAPKHAQILSAANEIVSGWERERR